MTTRRALLTAPAALLASRVAATPSRAATAPRGVIELFTSQGCSSCPPADELAAELARDSTLVVLTMPVTYWDGLGWKDTLASPAFTARQRAYATLRGDGQIYTPQAVVNGVAHAVGSDRWQIMALTHALPLSVTATRTAQGAEIEVAGGPAEAAILALPVLRSRTVAIGRGENADRSVTYTHIVRTLIPVGHFSSGTTRVSVPATIDADNGLAVLVQQGDPQRPGAILGAAML